MKKKPRLFKPRILSNDHPMISSEKHKFSIFCAFRNEKRSSHQMEQFPRKIAKIFSFEKARRETTKQLQL